MLATEIEQLKSYALHFAPRTVSIWMPTHPAGADVRQDPIRMRNLLHRAAEYLIDMAARPPEAQELLRPVVELVQDSGLWRQQGRGLGILLSDGDMSVHRLDTTVPELCTVGERYHIKPMFDTDQQDGAFHVLQLSQQEVRLLGASRSGIDSVPLSGAPTSLAEFLRFDQVEPHVEFHTGAAGHQPGTRRPASFHGQGSAGDLANQKRRLTEFCRRIDEEVCRTLQGNGAPLLLAAAEPLQGVYRQVSQCPRLDDRVIHGNPDEMEPRDLQAAALNLLAEDFERDARDARDRFGEAQSVDLASADLHAILPAAAAGAVDTLLVARDRQCWGRYGVEANELLEHETQQPGDEDLLNIAAVLACSGGAAVHAVRTDLLPDPSSPIAAIYRYRPVIPPA